MTGAEAAAVFKGLMFIAQTKAELSEKDMHAMLRSAMNPGSAARRIGGLARSATSNRSSNGRFAGPATTSKPPANDQQQSSKTPDAGDAGGATSSLSDLNSSPDPENSSSLSASSKPDSKRARPRRSKPPAKPKWSRMPDDFVPDDTHRAIAFEEGVSLERELAKCRDHEFNPPRSDAAATFRTWLRRAGEHLRARPPGLQEHQRTGGGERLGDKLIAKAMREAAGR